MAGFWDAAKGVLGGGLFSSGARNAAKDFLVGTPEKRENVSTLRPEQEPLYQQAVGAGLGPGAGGAFGDSADYYRDLLSNDPAALEAYTKPALRQYNEEIVPGLSEQFAGMGAGGLSSSGFRNAQIQGATDLSERIGQIRANLRQQGAQGLQNIGQTGLNNYSQNMVTEPGTEGFLNQAAPVLGNIASAYFGGPAATAFNAGTQNMTAKKGFGAPGGTNTGTNQSPYGGNSTGWLNVPASPGGR